MLFRCGVAAWLSRLSDSADSGVITMGPTLLEGPLKASDLFIKCLENEGVRYIFGVPGAHTPAGLTLLKAAFDLVLGTEQKVYQTWIPTSVDKDIAIQSKVGVGGQNLSAVLCTWPGEENLDFLESLRQSKSIQLVVTRHEQAAGFMAATVGRLTGGVGLQHCWWWA